MRMKWFTESKWFGWKAQKTRCQLANLHRQCKGFAKVLEKHPATLHSVWEMVWATFPHTHYGYEKERWESGSRYRSPDNSKRDPGECLPAAKPSVHWLRAAWPEEAGASKHTCNEEKLLHIPKHTVNRGFYCNQYLVTWTR